MNAYGEMTGRDDQRFCWEADRDAARANALLKQQAEQTRRRANHGKLTREECLANLSRLSEAISQAVDGVNR